MPNTLTYFEAHWALLQDCSRGPYQVAVIGPTLHVALPNMPSENESSSCLQIVLKIFSRIGLVQRLSCHEHVRKPHDVWIILQTGDSGTKFSCISFRPGSCKAGSEQGSIRTMGKVVPAQHHH